MLVWTARTTILLEGPAILESLAPCYDLTVDRVVGPWAPRASGLLGELEGQRVLDLCTGTGLMARELVRRKALVTGIDRSRRMLERARKACPQAEFFLMDMGKLWFPAPFDAATLSMGLHALPPAEAVTALRNLQAYCLGPLLILDWARSPSCRLLRRLLELAERAEGSCYREYMTWGPERMFAASGWRIEEQQELDGLVTSWRLEW